MTLSAPTVVPVGSAIEVQVLCKESVAGVLTAFDPTTVEVSFVSPYGTETVLTYAGGGALDDQLTRADTGKYEAFLVPDVAGQWKVRAKYTNSSGGVDIPIKSDGLNVTVTADGHAF